MTGVGGVAPTACYMFEGACGGVMAGLRWDATSDLPGHATGRNVVFFGSHVEFLKDAQTNGSSTNWWPLPVRSPANGMPPWKGRSISCASESFISVCLPGPLPSCQVLESGQGIDAGTSKNTRYFDTFIG